MKLVQNEETTKSEARMLVRISEQCSFIDFTKPAAPFASGSSPDLVSKKIIMSWTYKLCALYGWNTFKIKDHKSTVTLSSETLLMLSDKLSKVKLLKVSGK